jgi:ubiquinone/menaquinone biosynthesis C-methylase UbiE
MDVSAYAMTRPSRRMVYSCHEVMTVSSSHDVKHTVQQQFGRAADQYVTSLTHARGPDLALLVEWLHPQPDWHCLDIATGGGHVAKTLAPSVARVVASDLTPAMLHAARRHLRDAGCHNVDFVIADAENLPFLEETFDAVTCRIAPHHFPNPDRFVAEAARVLKPGGKLLLIDNVAPEDAECAAFLNTLEKLRDPSHVRCPSVREWEAWLSGAGLRVVRSRPRRKRMEFMPWVRRMATSDHHVAAVEAFVRTAPEGVRICFDIEINEERVAAITVDEWMAMCERL